MKRVVLSVAVVLLFPGCASLTTQSWDQANLKVHDHGCPTAIFIAPNGVLEQCP